MKRNFFIYLFMGTCFVSCEQALELPLEHKEVSLLAPTNNLITIDSVHTFYWEPLKGAFQYQLQIVSPRFDSITRLIVDTTIDRNQFNLTLKPNKFQWRVRAMNNTSSSKYSDTFHLTIQ